MLVTIVHSREFFMNIPICKQAHYLTQRFSLAGRPCVRIRPFSATSIHSIVWWYNISLYIVSASERSTAKLFLQSCKHGEMNRFDRGANKSPTDKAPGDKNLRRRNYIRTNLRLEELNKKENLIQKRKPSTSRESPGLELRIPTRAKRATNRNN